MTPHPTARFRDLTGRSNLHTKKLLAKHNLNYTYKARGAIYKILNSINKETKGNYILAPAFHCPTVIQPILLAGFKVKYYMINEDLSINEEDLIKQLDPSIAAIITINYFGFEQKTDSIKDLCHQFNSYLIEDCSHSFLKASPLELSGNSGDFAVYSFWKLIPSNVGGAIRINTSNHPQLKANKISTTNKNKLVVMKHLFEQAVENMEDGYIRKGILHLEQARVHAKKAKRPHQNTTNSRTPITENTYPFNEELFSDDLPLLPKRIIEQSNLQDIVQSRRYNYHLVEKSIIKSSYLNPAFKAMPDDTCPWAYPLILEKRNTIEQEIRSSGVVFFTFGEKLHESLQEPSAAASKDAQDAARWLSESLLCLPIHQGMSDLEVNRNCNQLNLTLNRVNQSL